MCPTNVVIICVDPNNPCPIKHWRKQLNPVDGSGRGRAGVGVPSDTPGGAVYLDEEYGIDLIGFNDDTNVTKEK